MHSMVSLLAVALLVGCGSGDDQADADAATATMAGPTLADFAGTWQNTAMLEGTPDPVPSTMTGSGDSSEWSMSLADRPDIRLAVTVVGDSLIAQSEEYESILRDGVMVSIRLASALHGDTMEGKLVATYRTPEGEQVVRGTTTGMRAPM